jgi:hypothetical protein
MFVLNLENCSNVAERSLGEGTRKEGVPIFGDVGAKHTIIMSGKGKWKEESVYNKRLNVNVGLTFKNIKTLLM